MYLAISRLQVMSGKENEFETAWKIVNKRLMV